MSQFDRNLTGWRFGEIRWNDTLQAIAARELNNAARWVDLVNINGLEPPYLTGDPPVAGPTVKLFGQLLIIPAAAPQVSAQTDPNAVFGVDCLLANGKLLASSGDFVTVAGRANLRQAIIDRIMTDKGELLFHLDYGCSVRRLIGQTNGPTQGLLAAQFVNAALLADPRIQAAPSTTAQVEGDTLAVSSQAVPVTGAPINVALAVPLVGAPVDPFVSA